MNSKRHLFAGILISGLVLASEVFAQTPKVDFPAASPTCTLKQRVGLTDIEVVYSRPSVKGRTIFGGLVPYGKVWRTGANQATRITFSTPVKINGNEVPAGTYALFTIPDKDEWTIILNKKADQFGAFQYDEKTDLLRFKTQAMDFDHSVETLTMDFGDIRDESATFYLVWENTFVPVKLEMDITDKLVSQITAALEAPGKKDDGFYFQSATFYYNHGQNLDKALEWVNAGLADNPRIAFEILHLKAQILAKQGDKEGAIAAAKKSRELAIKNEGPDGSFVQMDDDLISNLR